MSVIRTNYDYPPIPNRSMDWGAWFDDYDEGDIVGHGPTELEAIKDLLEQKEEQTP